MRSISPLLRALPILLAPFLIMCSEPQSGGRVTMGDGCGGDEADDDTGPSGDDDDTGPSDDDDDTDPSDDDDDDTDPTDDDDTGPSDDDDDDTVGDDDDTYDCANIPTGPFSYTVQGGIKAGEDLAFDDQGNLIGADAGNLFKSQYGGGFQIYVPSAGGFIAGLRALPGGDVVYSDTNTNTLFRADAKGNKWPVLSGLNYGNGIEIGIDGNVYVAEQTGGRVRRVDPDTGDFTILVEGLNNPNGISFSPDYSMLYIGSFGGGMIYKLPVDPDGNPGALDILVPNVGGGMLDGMGVDACGNIYVCEYVAAKVWRISPDGQHMAPIVNFSNHTSWIPNMQWGSGVGGWEENVLYVLDIASNTFYEVEVEVPAKPYLYP